jgi:hypothetical protein
MPKRKKAVKKGGKKKATKKGKRKSRAVAVSPP